MAELADFSIRWHSPEEAIADIPEPVKRLAVYAWAKRGCFETWTNYWDWLMAKRAIELEIMGLLEDGNVRCKWWDGMEFEVDLDAAVMFIVLRTPPAYHVHPFTFRCLLPASASAVELFFPGYQDGRREGDVFQYMGTWPDAPNPPR